MSRKTGKRREEADAARDVRNGRLTPEVQEQLRRALGDKFRNTLLTMIQATAHYYSPTEAVEVLQDQVDALRAAAVGHREPLGRNEIHIIFDGPPSHESGRFVEVETPGGKPISVGEWVERSDGLWALVVKGRNIA